MNDNSAKSNDDVSQLSANNRGAAVVKRSLHTPVDQQSLIDSSYSRSRSRHRRLRKKIHSKKLKNSPNIFQSTGTNHNDHRASTGIQTALDDRLKRFRMLDPDEFQEMLQSLSHQMPNEKTKELNSMDTIDGMQLESKLI
jgi:hypothetical protein